MYRLSELGSGVSKVMGNVVPIQEALNLHPRFLALESHRLLYLRRLFVRLFVQRHLCICWQFNVYLCSCLDIARVHKVINLRNRFFHLFLEVCRLKLLGSLVCSCSAFERRNVIFLFA